MILETNESVIDLEKSYAGLDCNEHNDVKENTRYNKVADMIFWKGTLMISTFLTFILIVMVITLNAITDRHTGESGKNGELATIPQSQGIEVGLSAITSEYFDN